MLKVLPTRQFVACALIAAVLSFISFWSVAYASEGAPGGGGTTYNVGPGQQYETIGAVPWYTLKAGDTVYIHWKSTPYYEKFLISGRGTPTQWIRVIGVPNPTTGALPIISGNNAVTSKNNHYRWQDVGTIQLLGLVQVAARADADVDGGLVPAYIEIAHLQLQDAYSSYKFTGENGTQSSYDKFAACVYARSVQHFLLRDSILTNCGQGFYNWTADGSGDNKQWWNGVAEDITIRGNYFYNNGASNSYTEHQIYTEAKGVVIENNHFGPPRNNMLGSQIKDRSVGTVVRYNYIEQSPSGYDIDLVEPEEAWPALGGLPSFKEAFVYGNLFVSDREMFNIVHWNEDHNMNRGRATIPGGKLYFHNNTVVAHADASGWEPVHKVFNTQWGGYDCPAGSLPGVIDVRNNIFASIPKTPGTTPIPFLFDYCKKANFNFVNNWVTPGAKYNGATNAGVATNVSPANNNPGFVNIAADDYRLAPGSSAIGITGAHAPELTSNSLGGDFRPTMQYQYRAMAVPRSSHGPGTDAGAFASGYVPTNPLPTAMISANPSTIAPGNTSVISWSSTNATSCSLSSGQTGTSGSFTTPALTSTATYTISCTGAGGTASNSVLVTVQDTTPPPVPPPTPSPSSKFSIGDSVITTSGIAVRSTAGGTKLGSQPKNALGTVKGGPIKSGSHTWWEIDYAAGVDGWSAELYLEKWQSPFAIGNRVETTDTIGVRSGPAGTKLGTQKTASAGTILSGPQSAKGNVWWEINYDTGTDGWSAQQYLTSSNTPAPTPTPTPTPTPAPTVTITATPESVTEGNTSVIAWSSTNATSCSLSSGQTGTSGSFTSPALTTNTTYTATCSGAGGSASKSVTVVVETETDEPNPNPPTEPTATISAVPASIAYGNTSVVSWSSTNATSCSLSSGQTGTSGSFTTPALTANTTYTVTCSGAGGTASHSATVSVQAPPAPAPTPGTLSVGASATSKGGGTSAAVALPSGVTAGNLLVVAIGQTNHQGFQTPAGWTKQGEVGNDYAGNAIAVYTRIADGSEGGTVTIQQSASAQWGAVAFIVTGYDATYMDGLNTKSAISGSFSGIIAPSITTTKAGSLVVRIGVTRSASTLSTPAGYTVVGEAGGSSWNTPRMQVAYAKHDAAGAVGEASFVASGETDRDWSAMTFAIAPSQSTAQSEYSQLAAALMAIQALLNQMAGQ